MASLFLVGLAVIAAVITGMVAGTQVSARLDRVLTRLALALFRDAVETEGRHQNIRSQQLQSIHATVTYPVYASKTLLFTAAGGVVGSIIGVYGFYLLAVFLATADGAVPGFLPPELHFILEVSPPPGLRPLVPTVGGGVTPLQVFALLLFSSATFGLLASAVTYYLRWWYVRSEAHRREVLIDESVARTIAFIYALSRSGMVYPKVMRTVAANRMSFGECAEEVGVVVKDMDLFGADLVTALQRIAERTPSEQFGDFAENFANVLRSGRNVSSYLEEQYEQYQEKRIANQERLLELFTALGEGYVAVLVAGPLFLITILIIFGILTGGLLEVLQLIVYILIPFANVGFMLYLNTLSSSLTDYHVTVRHDIAPRKLDVRRKSSVDGPASRADGGTVSARREMNRIRLSAYNGLRRWYRAVLNPINTVVNRPEALFAVTGPIVVLYVGTMVWFELQAGGLSIRAVDDIVIQAGLFLIGTFAVVQQIHSRRIRKIEEAVPDLLERLASTNEAGMTFTEGLKRVDRSDLGALDIEVSRLLNDINWGTRTERALNRFSDRIGSSTIARIVALITNAMLASGHVGPVIRISAEEAREDKRLRTKRRQEMFMYILIIYMSFFVFLGIAVALQSILIPAIPSAGELSNLAPPGELGVSMPISPASGAAKVAYTLLLFHGAIVQAVCSGFVAGQMGNGHIKDGAKHAAVMVLTAYVVFLVVV